MATNLISSNTNFSYVPSVAVTSGQLGEFDGRIGIALSARTTAELADTSRDDDINAITIATTEVYNVPVVGIATFAKGAKVYLISGTYATPTDTGSYVGTAWSANYTNADSVNSVDVAINANYTGA